MTTPFIAGQEVWRYEPDDPTRYYLMTVERVTPNKVYLKDHDYVYMSSGYRRGQRVGRNSRIFARNEEIDSRVALYRNAMERDTLIRDVEILIENYLTNAQLISLRDIAKEMGKLNDNATTMQIHTMIRLTKDYNRV